MRTFEPIKVNPSSAKPMALDSSIIKETRFFGSFTLFLRFWLAIQGCYTTLMDLDSIY